jgi:lactate dehydrogenase-like 2-hydroxyacid dehydrogenase
VNTQAGLRLAGLRRHPILVCGTLHAAALERIERFFEPEILTGSLAAAPLRERLTNKAALVVCEAVPIDANFLAGLRWLRSICRLAPGSPGIDLDACTRQGILVTDVPPLGEDATARARTDMIAAENLSAAFGFGRIGGHPPNLVNVELRCLLGCCA